MQVSGAVARDLAEVRRIVGVSSDAITQPDADRLASIAGRMWEDPLEFPTMPSGYGSYDLERTARSISGQEWPGARSQREQVFAAWAVRLGTEATDQAAIGARIDEMLAGAPASVQSSRGVAELRTLLHMSDDPRRVPTELGIANASELDQYMDSFLSYDLAHRGEIRAEGLQLLRNWQLVRDPDRFAAWKSAVDRSARDGSPLPDEPSLELVMSPAAGWGDRSHEERMRLLEGIATSGGRTTTAVARRSSLLAMSRFAHPEVFQHLDVQVARTLRHGAPLPDEITAWDVVNSATYDTATSAERLRLLEAYQAHASVPLFRELKLRHAMDADATAYARAQLPPILRATLDEGVELPHWVRVEDVLHESLTDSERLRLLQPFLKSRSTDHPEGAIAWMVDVRSKLADGVVGDGSSTADALRTRSLERIDLNVARIRGDVVDGYRGHPDYADIGRIMADVELLDGLARTARERSAAAAGDIVW